MPGELMGYLGLILSERSSVQGKVVGINFTIWSSRNTTRYLSRVNSYLTPYSKLEHIRYPSPF